MRFDVFTMRYATLCLLSLLLPLSAWAQSYLVYFGTGDKAIYVSRFDAATGTLSDPEVAAMVERPNFLELHADGGALFVCSRADGPDGGVGLVIAYRIDRDTGKLTKINQQSTGGPGPAHVAVSGDGKSVAVANYGGGSTSSFRVGAGGRLVARSSVLYHEGKSVNPQRQSEPHSHSVNFSPDSRFVISADLGLDQLLVYEVDPATSALRPNDPPFATVEPGSGPRHFAFHPNGRLAYAINEMGNTVSGFTWDASRGALSHFQTISTLPEGYSEASHTAEVQIHPNGRFLYGSNRGHDSISVFSIDQGTGKLTNVERAPVQGKTPRNFRMDPEGKWLLAANQASDAVVVFKVDPRTGKLTPTGRGVKMPSPMCVRFLRM